MYQVECFHGDCAEHLAAALSTRRQTVHAWCNIGKGSANEHLGHFLLRLVVTPFSVPSVQNPTKGRQQHLFIFFRVASFWILTCTLLHLKVTWRRFHPAAALGFVRAWKFSRFALRQIICIIEHTANRGGCSVHEKKSMFVWLEVVSVCLGDIFKIFNSWSSFEVSWFVFFCWLINCSFVFAVFGVWTGNIRKLQQVKPLRLISSLETRMSQDVKLKCFFCCFS